VPQRSPGVKEPAWCAAAPCGTCQAGPSGIIGIDPPGVAGFALFQRYRLLAFGLMLMVLMVFRPQGLLTSAGRREEEAEPADEQVLR
jgi:hypothetical protein